MENLVENIVNDMEPYLSQTSKKELRLVLERRLSKMKFYEDMDENHIELFMAAKTIEGISVKTRKKYKSVLDSMQKYYGRDPYDANTEDIRRYLSDYQETHHISGTSLDTRRRFLSSFYSWLECEGCLEKIMQR